MIDVLFLTVMKSYFDVWMCSDLMCSTCLSAVISKLCLASISLLHLLFRNITWILSSEYSMAWCTMWLTWLWLLLQRWLAIAWIIYHWHSQTLVINYGHVAGQVWISDIMWRLWDRRRLSWHEEKCVHVCVKKKGEKSREWMNIAAQYGPLV